MGFPFGRTAPPAGQSPFSLHPAWSSPSAPRSATCFAVWVNLPLAGGSIGDGGRECEGEVLGLPSSAGGKGGVALLESARWSRVKDSQQGGSGDEDGGPTSLLVLRLQSQGAQDDREEEEVYGGKGARGGAGRHGRQRGGKEEAAAAARRSEEAVRAAARHMLESLRFVDESTRLITHMRQV